jgi:transcriptional regulator with XRE-family HTH domain
MSTIKTSGLKANVMWTATLIRMLRGKRTQVEFGELLGVPKNLISRWESGHSKPHAQHAQRLANLAAREHFLEDWELAGSMTVVGDLEEASRALSAQFKESLSRTARQFVE